jgi:hypothetical protein
MDMLSQILSYKTEDVGKTCELLYAMLIARLFQEPSFLTSQSSIPNFLE